MSVNIKNSVLVKGSRTDLENLRVGRVKVDLLLLRVIF